MTGPQKVVVGLLSMVAVLAYGLLALQTGAIVLLKSIADVFGK